MGQLGKQRSALVVILLGIVTLGIYALYWQYATFKEMKGYGGQGVGGVIGLVLAIFVGFVNWFLMPYEASNLYRNAGREPPVSAATGFWVLLPIIGGIIWTVKLQGALNRFWETAPGQPVAS